MENINKELMALSAVHVVSLGRKIVSKKILKALSEHEIINIMEIYSEAALVCKEAGYTGAQIHGAHGFLVRSFYLHKQILELISGAEA